MALERLLVGPEFLFGMKGTLQTWRPAPLPDQRPRSGFGLSFFFGAPYQTTNC